MLARSLSDLLERRGDGTKKKGRLAPPIRALLAYPAVRMSRSHGLISMPAARHSEVVLPTKNKCKWNQFR